MGSGIDRQLTITGILFLISLIVLSGIGAAHPGPGPQEADVDCLTTASETLDSPPIEGARLGTQVQEEDEEEQEGEEEGEEEEDDREGEADDEEEGVSILGDWWGLGNEAAETPYIGLVEAGVVVLGVGLSGYTFGKQASLVSPRFRRYLLPAHEWTMLVGTALTVPHFLAVEEWEGLGFAVGVLLVVEVLSGLYGRHLHRYAIRLGRGTEQAPLLGRLIEMSTERLFSRWRQAHISLTVVTGLVLLLHIVTALGD